jgi:RNA polymerase sigma factor (sigma-70 family)
VSGVETKGAAALFAEHAAPLRRYVARFTGDAALAEDIAQEAFVRLLEHGPADDIARAWLYRVATNLALDSTRTAARRRTLVRNGRALLAHADPPPPPERRVERDAARRAVADALAGLSEKERMALLMREEGFAHREIAEAVGTTTGSVGTLLARALRKAAARLGPVQEDA